jgi:negative regulator of flagellin synthesis FlgM
MRVNDAAASAIARTYTRQVTAPGAEAARLGLRQSEGRARTDSVSLSDTTQQLLKLREVVAAQSEVRADRVAALKAAITGGKYQVDAQALAARMLGAGA